MRFVLTALTIVLLLSASAKADEWRPLFNGKDLSGWTPKIAGRPVGENFANTFRVEDGLLMVRFDEYNEPYNRRFGHLFYKDSFSHYRVRVECRSVGEQVKDGPEWARRNNGLMLHGQAPDTLQLEQAFPVSLEVQILAGLDDGKPRSTANLCTPGTHVEMNGRLDKRHCISSSSPTIPHGQWVTIEAEVRGRDVIRHFVNGQQVMEYRRPVLDPKDDSARRLLDSGAPKELSSGTISLQAESAPYDFRRIEFMELDP